MGNAHQEKPLFRAAVVPAPACVFPDPARQLVCLFVNVLQDALRDLLRSDGLDAHPQPVNLADAPHFQAVGHVPHGAFHASAGCGGYGHGLLFTHFRQRPVDHPPGPQVVQKIHHGACGMIHIHRTCQDQQLRLPDGRRKGFQRRKMGTAAQICLKASAAAQAGPVKIPRQEELPDLPAHLAGKLPCHHAGASLMALAVNDDDLHLYGSSPDFFCFRACRSFLRRAFPSGFSQRVSGLRPEA